jgi:hypothetical protein
VIELLNSSEAKKLLAPVPQLVIPPSVTSSAHYNTSIDDVMKHATETVNPVDFEYTNALVESSRTGSKNVTKGKILACRTPDLMIKYNRVVVSLEWEAEHVEKGGGKTV